MHIVDKGTVFERKEDTDYSSCTFPGICVLPDGRWLCTFRSAPKKKTSVRQQAQFTWSDDEGKSWSQPVAPFSPRPVADKPGLFRGAYVTSMGGPDLLAALFWVDHSDPSLPYFNEDTEGILDARIFIAGSTDRGMTWSEPRLLNTSVYDVPVGITGPLLCLPDGSLACQFELNKHYYDTSDWQHSSVMIFSKDCGRSWTEHAITSRDPGNRIFYWDQRPGVLADGVILDLFWTYDTATASYLSIHARESLDYGRTWSDMWDTTVPGQPAAPVSTPDGNIAMAYVDRAARPAIKMRRSVDGGRNWPEASEIVLCEAPLGPQTRAKENMQDAWAEMADFSMGLPATALAPNGDIILAYYNGPATDRTNIEWVRVRCRDNLPL